MYGLARASPLMDHCCSAAVCCSSMIIAKYAARAMSLCASVGAIVAAMIDS
jgi:hypothetical protein